DRRQRLVRRVRGSAKQPYLLPRHNRDRPVRQPFQIGLRLRPRAQLRVLLAKNRSHFPTALCGVIQLAACLRHRLDRGRVGIERLHALKLLQISEKELRLVGELAERESATIHERLDELREKTSHQFPGSCRVRTQAGRSEERRVGKKRRTRWTT